MNDSQADLYILIFLESERMDDIDSHAESYLLC